MMASASKIGPCDSFTVSVTVTNTGNVDSDEVVQVYAQLPDATVPTTLIRLVSFDRVFIRARSSTIVSLAVSPASHAVVHPKSDVYQDSRVVEPGTIELSIGGGQPGYTKGTLSGSVTVTAGSDLKIC